MPIENHPPERPRSSPVKEIHIIWITAGLSCDGDTIAMTAATQPSLEDVLPIGKANAAVK